MKNLLKTTLISSLLLMLNSCSASMVGPSSNLRSNPEIIRVGDLEVRLYQDRDRMSRELPSSLAWTEALKIGSRQVKVLGYYDKENKRIFSIDDTRVLLHELKHYLEPHWRHELGANYLEPIKEGMQSACVDCVPSHENNPLLTSTSVPSHGQEHALIYPDYDRR